MNTQLITTGILIAPILVLLGSGIALLHKSYFAQKCAQIAILLGLLSGTIASGAMLSAYVDVLTIFSWGLKLELDHVGAIFFFLINVVGMAAVWYGMPYIQSESERYHIGYVQFLLGMFLIGMQMVVLSANTLFFMLAWETMSIASFFLVIADFRTSAIPASLFYLIMTHLGAGALLAAFLIISGGSLTMDFAAFPELAKTLSPATVTVVFVLFFFGFGSKAGLFPFHGWLPLAHPAAPSHISALMSGVMLKLAVFGFLKVLTWLIPLMPFGLSFSVLSVGLLSAIFGVLYAVLETDIKRILAFSSIENMGLLFAMIGIMIFAQTQNLTTLADIALTVVLFHSLCHGFFKSGLFLSTGVMGHVFHTRNIEKMGGMAKHMKVFSLVVLLLSLSAAALPPTGTFMSEWLILQSLIEQIATAPMFAKIVLLIVFTVFGFVGGIAVFAMVRFFGLAFLGRSRTSSAHLLNEPETGLLLPVGILGVLVMVFGGASQFLLPIIGGTAASAIHFPFSPLTLFAVLVAVVIAALILRLLFAPRRNERKYHSWDCGQPIDAGMEYTATAFSAPFRFFFCPLLRASKKIESEPVVPSNPWIVRKRIVMETRPVWDEYFYEPVLRAVTFLSTTLRKLQNGIVQFYIALILLTLIITAVVTL